MGTLRSGAGDVNVGRGGGGRVCCVECGGNGEGGVVKGVTFLCSNWLISCSWRLSESVSAGMGEFLDGFWRIFKISFVAAIRISVSEVFGMEK